MTAPAGPATDAIDAIDRLAQAAIAWLDREGERLATVVPEVSRWSPRMQLDHAALTALSICGMVESILAREASCLAPGQPGPQLTAILTAGFIPRGRADAPAALTPAPTVTHAETREHLVAVRARLGALAPRGREIEAAEGRLPHFALGPMNAAEWLLFAKVHFDHHAAIARDILDG